jgi:hypothetical protein
VRTDLHVVTHLEMKVCEHTISCSVICLIPSHVKNKDDGEISSSHGGEYDVQYCLLGCTAV